MASQTNSSTPRSSAVNATPSATASSLHLISSSPKPISPGSLSSLPTLASPSPSISTSHLSQQSTPRNTVTETSPSVSQPRLDTTPQRLQPTEISTPEDEDSSDGQKPGQDVVQGTERPAPEAQPTPTRIESPPARNQPPQISQTPTIPLAPKPSPTGNSPTAQRDDPTPSKQPDPNIVSPDGDRGSKLSSVGVVVPVIPTTLRTATNSISPNTENEVGRGSSTAILSTTSAVGAPFLGNEPETTSTVPPNVGVGRTGGGVGATDDTSHSGQKNMSTGAIVGISVGAFAAVSLIALLFWLWRRRSMKKRTGSLYSPVADPDTNPRQWGQSGIGISPQRLFRPRRDPSSLDNFGVSNVAAVAPNMAERTAAPGLLGRGRINNQEYTEYAPLRYNGHSRDNSNTIGTNQPNFGLGQRQIEPSNPFSDRNAVDVAPQLPSLPATALVFDMPWGNQSKDSGNAGAADSRTSRGRSLSATVRASQYPSVPPAPSRPHSVHRESIQSVDSFTNKRNKFRSDPFDLEIESRLISGQSPIPEMPRRTAASSTYSAQPDSGPSSRYTSGVSVSGWSVIHAGGASSKAVQTQANNIISWDHPRSSEFSHPSGVPRPLGDKRQPGVVFGQAL
ncbi:sugar transporter [Pochonia chlamydosporia 170]|uniref:Sugar transporter n=1 Tax=Pochonia chlamydosporia 170 TaxID=1380566 RepID=A0A179FNH0_METCM|nr:sugar transporter [Pochonia chlamydosporia 170]OAQ66613.1 sugar transporter [Pochonia chlamydosporia 170]